MKIIATSRAILILVRFEFSQFRSHLGADKYLIYQFLRLSHIISSNEMRLCLLRSLGIGLCFLSLVVFT